MEHLNYRNLSILIIILFVCLGCVKYKNTSSKDIATVLSLGILSLDSITPANVTAIAIKSIRTIIPFVEDVKDGNLTLTDAFNLIKNIDVGEGNKLGELLDNSQLKIIEILIEDMYIDLKPVGNLLPDNINPEFANKFVEVLRATVIKLDK